MNGVLNPVILRKKEGERYEIIAGHRRKYACRKLDIKLIPSIVRELSREDAIIEMVDSNLQRECILPSEKARAYKMKMDAMKRKAGRPSKDNSVPLAHNYEGKKTREIVAEQSGESPDQVRRYVRLNELTPELLEFVDEGNTRVTALKEPIVDADRGIAVSIRMLHPARVDRASLIDTDSLTDEMLSFLETCLRYGVSFVVAGRTSSGKTTLLNSLLGSIPDSKRIYTIESGARELSLVKRDEQGRVINNVVHTLSRPSDKDIYDITQEDLVMAALRFDPDVICVGEMRDAEAHSAVEASSTDHTVVTTVHGGGGRYAHRRIAFLSQRRFPIDMKISMQQVALAFPVVVFAHKLEDNTRKVMDISECIVHDDGELEYGYPCERAAIYHCRGIA